MEGGDDEQRIETLSSLNEDEERLEEAVDFMVAKKMKQRKKIYNNFVANLQIPCYKGLSYYYYYDVLEAFSRHLFQ